VRKIKASRARENPVQSQAQDGKPMSDSASERVVHHTESGKREIDGGEEKEKRQRVRQR
jgi:hypothetical protein